MGWDRKARGPDTGYFYISQRTPDGVRKRYVGRGAAGQLAAAFLEQARRERHAARDAVRAEATVTAEADRLAGELDEWARILTAAWMTATGHHFHRGTWRRRRGQEDAQGGVTGLGADVQGQPRVREGGDRVAHPAGR